MASEAEERSKELEAKVEKATFEQIESQLQADLCLLREKLPGKVCQAVETALDMKYVRDRQRIFGFTQKCFILFAFSFAPAGAMAMGQFLIEKLLDRFCQKTTWPAGSIGTSKGLYNPSIVNQP